MSLSFFAPSLRGFEGKADELRAPMRGVSPRHGANDRAAESGEISPQRNNQAPPHRTARTRPMPD
jgi:hypothetical protein